MPSPGPGIYQKVQAESAPPRRVLVVLYRRLDADLKRARACIEAGDVAGKARAVDHAFAILGQLEVALDHDLAPELCRNLALTYAFCKGRLLQASLEMETAPLDEAARVLSPIHEAFAQVVSGNG